jgi:hypothetical protein
VHRKRHPAHSRQPRFRVDGAEYRLAAVDGVGVAARARSSGTFASMTRWFKANGFQHHMMEMKSSVYG